MQIRQDIKTSESLTVGFVMALAGGFMDAYSYLVRGHVFANAQTGNMLLLGVNLLNGELQKALAYLLPVLSFAFGVAASLTLRRLCTSRGAARHWRQLTVAVEILLLLAVCFIPASIDAAANALTSLVCGIQVESFLKIRGCPAATTMCIGNLRSGIENLHGGLADRDRAALKRAAVYFGLILFFVLGAAAGSIFADILGLYSMAVNCVILLLAFALLSFERAPAPQDAR